MADWRAWLGAMAVLFAMGVLIHVGIALAYVAMHWLDERDRRAEAGRDERSGYER